jgi:xylan 1,4-beta-xylosidase
MLKPSLIFACFLSTLCGVACSISPAQEITRVHQARPADELSRRLEAAMQARKSGDPAAVGMTSQKLIALGLIQMARFRLDQRDYDHAAKLFRESLEFEDGPETHLDLAIANLYAKKPSEAEKEASLATEGDPQDPLAWTIKGEALLQNKNYSGAAAALERALALKRDEECLYALGIAYLGLGEKQKAADCFSQIFQLVGDSGWARILVGRAYSEQKFPQEAVEEFQKALRLDPRTPNAHYFWALTVLENNEWNPTEEIRLQLQEELKLNPRHFQANYLVGFFASNDRNYDESDRYLHLAAQINPSMPEVWMYLGFNANARNDNRSAETLFRKAIALKEGGKPGEHLSIRRAYISLGRTYLSSGRTKEGEELLQTARELQLEDLREKQANVAGMKTKEGAGVSGAVVPYIPETENQISVSLRFAKAPSEGSDSRPLRHPASRALQDPAGKAEKQLRAILGSSFNDLATAEALQEKYDLAAKHYREAARWDSETPGLERNLGLAAFFVGEHAEAIRLLTKTIAATPSDAHARAVLGLAYFATENYAKAAQTISLIADEALQDPQLGFAWAKSLARTGNKKGAARALESLERADSSLDVKSLIQFGQLWNDLGETERAAQSFRRALLVDPANPEAIRLSEEAARMQTQGPRGQESSPKQLIEIDTAASSHPFPHFWEKMFGSGRAILSLRESYRHDLRETKRITGFEYVRFHAIFHDEAGFYDEDKDSKPVYNFSYVDQIYDGLLENHVRPFIELSFTPRKLSSDPNALHAFWYKQNVAPPKDWDKWEQLIESFTRHLVDRYGIEEVAQWYFEVWNEPNIDFWAGNPKEATYYELYDRAARAIKRVSPRLRVGGPATAQAAWVDRFLAHCKEKNIPVDFASTHVYGNDKAEDVFGTHEQISRNQMVCRAVKKVHDQIAASPYPHAPLIWSEFNASYMNEPAVTDTAFMGPWMADTISQCDGLTQMMSYWTFSDVFEEQGVVKTPFYGGFGLLAERGIPKAAFNDFALLHQLGDARLEVNSESALVTRRSDGSLAIAVWNLFLPEEAGSPKTVTLHFKGLSGAPSARITIVDKDHGSPLPAWDKMGHPAFPTLAQIRELRQAAALPAAQSQTLQNGSLTLTLQPQALALIELGE